jgi:hypothetical protein
MASEPSDYRAQVESLLAAAAELPAPAQEANPHGRPSACRREAAANVVRGTPAANLGERFLALTRRITTPSAAIPLISGTASAAYISGTRPSRAVPVAAAPEQPRPRTVSSSAAGRAAPEKQPNHGMSPTGWGGPGRATLSRARPPPRQAPRTTPGRRRGLCRSRSPAASRAGRDASRRARCRRP